MRRRRKSEREREKNVGVSHLVLAKLHPERNDTPNQVQNILFSRLTETRVCNIKKKTKRTK